MLGEIGGLVVCCSVLPWTASGGGDPWTAADHAARMAATLEAIAPALAGRDVIWGGDWNQPMVGNLAGFSRSAQRDLLAVIERLEFQVPTAALT